MELFFITKDYFEIKAFCKISQKKKKMKEKTTINIEILKRYFNFEITFPFKWFI